MGNCEQAIGHLSASDHLIKREPALRRGVVTCPVRRAKAVDLAPREFLGARSPQAAHDDQNTNDGALEGSNARLARHAVLQGKVSLIHAELLMACWCGHCRQRRAAMEYSAGLNERQPTVESMDRLRSLQYFVAAADSGSLSGAARRFGVSVAAVAKLIGALERELGVTLLTRQSSGITLTAAGAAYLEACRPSLDALEQADEMVRAAASPQPRGTVVVGMPIVIAQEVFVPAMGALRAKHPELQIDLRSVQQVSDPAAAGCDLLVLLGWPTALGDFIHRPIGVTRMIVAASPAYWERHGVPTHPRDLAAHQCLTLRGSTGTQLDLWKFRRGDETVEVPVRGWLVTDNAQRNAMLGAAVAGLGVVHLLDWNRLAGHHLAAGTLVTALDDWDMPDVPAVNLLYRPSVRRLPRVRAFIDFASQLFDDLQQRRERPLSPSLPPRWMSTRHARASTIAWRGP